ncbi:MAG TPA: dihydroorotase family protein [Candidatus Saccharimonadales bacterium]|jgi:dihydroorotase|nr:dihydroorotase family protein [Candidatus Saccharimonadales bacterium]
MSGMNGELVLPGFVDPHVHLREPGNNYAETIASGTRAALLGGYALIGDMPNTPGRPTWSVERILEKQAIAHDSAYIPTTYHAGSQPESDNIGELEGMSRLSLWLKLYGAPTTGNANDYEASDFRDIVAEWHRVAPDKPIGFHTGRDNLEDMIALVAGEFEHPLHIHHISSSREVNLVLEAKQHGWEVTSGVCPHYLLKTAHDVRSEGWFARMQPPLTTPAEAEELMRYLADGSIDIVETDHAPHTIQSKLNAELENPDGIHGGNHTTCFGVPGIELATPLMFYQVKRGYITIERLIDAMSTRPAQIMGLRVGAQTQVTWDMSEYRIGEAKVQSQAAWAPYLGKLVIGFIKAFEVQGERLISDGNIVGRVSTVVTKRSMEI